MAFQMATIFVHILTGEVGKAITSHLLHDSMIEAFAAGHKKHNMAPLSNLLASANDYKCIIEGETYLFKILEKLELVSRLIMGVLCPVGRHLFYILYQGAGQMFG